MQLEDKLVDGLDAAHAESRQREDMDSRGAEALPEPIIEAMRDAGLEKRGQLLDAVRLILDGQQLFVAALQVPQLEARALEALQVAVSGKSRDLSQFVYASDRRDLLERALGVLQPSMTGADQQTAYELHDRFSDLAERVGSLRHELTELEDSQDELLEDSQKEALAQSATAPKPKPVPTDPDAPRPQTTLTGPELAEPTPPPTTLVGPELPEPPRPPTTLVGPELPESPRPPTSLSGPELDGPEPVPEASPASSLGDAAELAAQAKRPWWRPFG